MSHNFLLLLMLHNSHHYSYKLPKVPYQKFMWQLYLDLDFVPTAI